MCVAKLCNVLSINKNLCFIENSFCVFCLSICKTNYKIFDKILLECKIYYFDKTSQQKHQYHAYPVNGGWLSLGWPKDF